MSAQLARPIERWGLCNPQVMATHQSATAIEIAFADARHDILLLAARQRDDLLAALRDVLRIATAASIGVTGNQPRLDRARAAIANATGSGS